MDFSKPPEVSAFDYSEESENEISEDTHNSLLESIGIKKDKRSRIQKQRTEASRDISVFSLNDDDGKLNLNQLVKGVGDTVSINKLKKKLNKIEQNGKQLDTPLPRVVAERIERKVEYEKAAVEVTKWDEVVQKNRRSDHISFPLNQEHLQVQKIDEFVARRKKNLTPLEEQIYALLGGSNKTAEREDHDLSLLEDEALKSMSLSEARHRRSELQKHRALMSFHESKNRRLRKIKSKKFHRIMKKKKMKENVEENEGSTEQAMKMRAEERATLKHRMGSKWAKNRVLMAKHDEKTKHELQEQLKKHRELVEKKVEVDGVNMEEEFSDTNDDDFENNDVSLPNDTNNPWLSKVEQNNNGIRNCDTETNDNIVNRSSNLNNENERSANENGGLLPENVTENGEVKNEPNTPSKMDLNPDSTETDSLREWLGKKDITPPPTPILIPSSNSPAVDKFKDAYKLLKTKGEKNRKKMEVPEIKKVVEDDNVATDPSKAFSIPTQILEAVVESSDDEQKLTIEEAFADDDVLAEFTEEKKKIIQENEPKEVDLSLPGWGRWGGVGIKPKKNRRKFRFRPLPEKPRSDRKLGHVIINENRNIHIAKHQVNQIPFPFVDSNQFERTIARPIGSTWNTPSAVKDLTKPKVTTVMGAIIEPMHSNEVKTTDVQNKKVMLKMKRKEWRKKDRLLKLKELQST